MSTKLTIGETGDLDFSMGKIHNPSQKERRIRTEIEKLQHPCWDIIAVLSVHNQSIERL